MSHDDDKLDKALGTRAFCVVGLGVSWFSGTAAFGGGCYCVYLSLYGNGAHFAIPHLAKEVLPLGINIIVSPVLASVASLSLCVASSVPRFEETTCNFHDSCLRRLMSGVQVTFLNESMGYIHSTSLRWSMLYEDRLNFNSNLRLLSSSHKSRPNAWYSNFLFIFYIILSYATTSLIFLGWNSDLTKTFPDHNPNGMLPQPDMIHVSGVALIFFGIGLLGQAFIATWSLRSTTIPTVRAKRCSPLASTVLVFACLSLYTAAMCHKYQTLYLLYIYDQAG
jgi:hypothetical protein